MGEVPRQGEDLQAGAHRASQEDVPSDQGIAETPGQRTVPRDDPFGPVTPEVGLEGEVKKPGRSSRQKGQGELDADQHDLLAEVRDLAGREHPCQLLGQKDEGAEPEGPLPIAPSLAEVAAGQKDRP